ncbi:MULTISPECIES: ChaN family lipoprotein [unclassified Janthinobacterium]|uniref:ChaN family lipoprotein n=1 Tax=unclassified Janthinobacterium TaxID=2610881 RepID=UPI0018C9A757|nr:ChaN family lipoprotein [Janthinobacterium sp. CG_23.4]MDH6159078.1 putative iron-regulated protein [Janthinobacterium sp. CG_23.4]
MKFPLSFAAVLPACVLALSACSSVAPLSATSVASVSAQDVRQLGEIVDLRSGQRLSAEQLLVQLAAAPRVIVGEQHDQLSHHQIEQWLLQQLQGQRPQGSVLLEMLNPDQQAKVDKVKPWLQTDPVVRPAHVAELLAWQPSWKWEQYGDLVMTLMRAPYPLWSANLDRSEIKQMFIDKPAVQGIHSNLANDGKVHEKLQDIIRVMHDNQIDAPRLAAMLSVQQQRDRRMAERLLAAPAPAVLIAGAYHAHKDLGVPLHVRDLTGGPAPLVLVLAPRGATVLATQADFVWFTPAVAEAAAVTVEAAATAGASAK